MSRGANDGKLGFRVSLALTNLLQLMEGVGDMVIPSRSKDGLLHAQGLREVLLGPFQVALLRAHFAKIVEGPGDLFRGRRQVSTAAPP